MKLSAGYLTNVELFSEYQRLSKSSYEYFSVLSELKLRNLITEEEFFNHEFIIKISNHHLKNLYKEFDILKRGGKKDARRIKLPRNSQELWMQHKYSIMARNIELYKKIGRKVAKKDCFNDLLDSLSIELRKRPKKNGILNALQHMWGYISVNSDIKRSDVEKLSLYELFLEIQKATLKSKEKYLYQQTALSELEIWIIEEGNYDIKKELSSANI